MAIVDNALSFAASIIRLGRGAFPSPGATERPAPARPLELYDFEACPYCRKVREVLCELDLDYVERPVAQGSPRRAELIRLGGKMQAPYLVDPNTGTRLYESEDINAYLRATYGGERSRFALPVVVDTITSAVASGVRLARGGRCRVTTERPGLEPLLLYNMEGSPYCRKVREVLAELDLVYLVRNVPKGSRKREELLRRGGKVQVPYLVDPNTRRELYESDDITAYLESQYGPAATTAERPRAATTA